MGMRTGVSCFLPLVIKLSQFLQHCGLSYLGLIVGSDVDKLIDLIMGGIPSFKRIERGDEGKEYYLLLHSSPDIL